MGTDDIEYYMAAKGDLQAGTGVKTFVRVAVGVDGQSLVADSSTTSGLAWGGAGVGQSDDLEALILMMMAW